MTWQEIDKLTKFDYSLNATSLLSQFLVQDLSHKPKFVEAFQRLIDSCNTLYTNKVITQEERQVMIDRIHKKILNYLAKAHKTIIPR